MQCYFFIGPEVCDIEALAARSDREAIAEARDLFHGRDGLDGFEVWDCDRIVHRERAVREP